MTNPIDCKHEYAVRRDSEGWFLYCTICKFDKAELSSKTIPSPDGLGHETTLFLKQVFQEKDGNED